MGWEKKVEQVSRLRRYGPQLQFTEVGPDARCSTNILWNLIQIWRNLNQ